LAIISSLEKITGNEFEGDIWLFVDWAVDSENGNKVSVVYCHASRIGISEELEVKSH
jgi:hypothetical protein